MLTPGGRPRPHGELGFVELVVLMEVEAAHVLVPGRSRRERAQRLNEASQPIARSELRA